VFSLFFPLTAGTIFLALTAWVLLQPTKAEMVAGWLWNLLGWLGRGARRRAVAFRVQGEINVAREAATRCAPKNIIEGRARVKFRRADETKAVLDRGEVVVIMRESDHHGENVAHALMAYLPKAVLPRARRYIDEDTMKAADLTLAKALLADDARPPGALECLYEEHLDPAATRSQQLNEKLGELDEIDLHGWLTRVLLAEFRALGDQLYPGASHPAVLLETERLEQWLYRLATQGPGEYATSLRFEGKLFRVAIIFVAIPKTLATKGITPYRRRAKNHLYANHVDAVYLMARDHNIPALKQIVQSLDKDARIADAKTFEYPLRRDFSARRLPRTRAAVSCLRRRGASSESLVPVREGDDDDAELPADSVYMPEADVEPSVSIARSQDPGTVATRSRG
jgi:hypothetical protein